MTNWLLEQQLLVSLLLLALTLLENKAIKALGANTLYALWSLVPILLIVNNLPRDVISIDDNSIYTYVVELDATQTFAQLNVNWDLIWAVGFVSILLLGAHAQRQVNRLLRQHAMPIKLDQTLPNRLSVVASKEIAGPLLSGIIHSTLIVPETFHSLFTKRQQQLMIEHELVHFFRGDNLYNLLALLFVAVFWFNPLTWFAYRAFRRSQELSCDSHVLRQSSQDDKICYSKALVQCAENSLHSFSIYSPYGEKHTMLKRILHIQNTRKIKPPLIGLSIAISSCFIAGVALANLTNAAHSVDKSSAQMAQPVMRIEPKYPIKAAENNIEGSVILAFDIAKDGSTDNIKVVEAFPQKIFEKESIRALKEWKYKPRIQGGKAQRQTGLQVQLDFRMDTPYAGQTAQTSQIEKIKVSH